MVHHHGLSKQGQVRGENTAKGGKNTLQRVGKELSLCDVADKQDYVTCS